MREKDELVQKANYEAMGLMAFELSHTVANFFQGIVGKISYLFLVLEQSFPKAHEAVKEQQESILSLIVDLGRIAGEIGAYQGSTEETRQNELKAVDMADVLESVLFICSTKIRVWETNIEKSFEANISKVLGNANLLKLMFLNIIRNAIEGVPHRGNIRLEISNQQAIGRIKVRITDDGCGIPDEIAERIFEDGFTTKDEGTGLGLATAKLITELHNGSIEFESEVGKGTSFIVYLPKANDEEE